MRKRNLKSLLSATVATPAVVLGLCTAAHAAPAPAPPVTFAQFSEATDGGPANAFTYTETGVAGSGGASTFNAVSVPVTFTFLSLPGLPGDLTGIQHGHLTLTSTSSAPVMIGFGGLLADQQFTTTPPATSTLTITRDTPALEGNGTKTNLLTMNFTGQLMGGPGGATALLTGQTALKYTVNYSSDFVGFATSTVQDFALGFTSWTSTATQGGLSVDPVSNFYNNATAAGVGTFDAQTSVGTPFPEPTTLALAAMSAVPMLMGRRRRAAR